MLLPKEILDQETGQATVETRTTSDDTSSKWSIARDVFFLVVTTIGLSYFAAHILDYKGLMGPIAATFDPVIGDTVKLFLLCIIGIVAISLHMKTLDWSVARKWLIPVAIYTTVIAIANVHFPGYSPMHHPKVQAFKANALNEANEAGVRFQAITGSAHVYKIEEEKVIQLEDKLNLGKKYVLIDGRRILEINNMKFMEIRYETGFNDQGAYSEKTGWVNMDDGVIVRKTASENFSVARLSGDTFKITFFADKPVKIMDWEKGKTITFVSMTNPMQMLTPGGNSNYMTIPINFPITSSKNTSLTLIGKTGSHVIIKQTT